MAAVKGIGYFSQLYFVYILPFNEKSVVGSERSHNYCI